MRTRCVRSVAALSGTLFLLTLATACSSSSDSSTNPQVDPLIGTWHATSFVALGTDYIAQGLQLSFTFNDDDTYSIQIGNDLILQLCDNQATSCTQTGTYSHTATGITLDPGTVDSTALTYTTSGNTLHINGDIDGTPIQVTLTKS